MSNTLSEQVAELEAERDHLKERVSLLEAAPRVPLKDFRVIAPEDLRRGQWIAFSSHSENSAAGQWTVEQWTARVPLAHDYDGTIVLLADAPEPAEDSPKRLTGEDMDAAPAGSHIENDRGIKVYRKDVNGRWGLVGSLGYVYNPADIPEELPTATITPPVEPVKVGDTLFSTEEEELEALPEGTILRGFDGDSFERGSNGWWMTGVEGQVSSSLAINHVPFTVLYLPEEDA